MWTIYLCLVQVFAFFGTLVCYSTCWVFFLNVDIYLSVSRPPDVSYLLEDGIVPTQLTKSLLALYIFVISGFPLSVNFKAHYIIDKLCKVCMWKKFPPHFPPIWLCSITIIYEISWVYSLD